MVNVNSRQFPELYKSLGINVSDLGCIMLDVAPLEVTALVQDGEKDLFYGKIPELKYAQGAVAEKTAHLTLLFGLLQSGTAWKTHVDDVLSGWTPPTLRIESVGVFPSNIAGQDYSVIIGHVAVTPELMEGHERLQLLPHVDTFPGYKAHITLAYVKSGAWEKWVRALNAEYKGQEFEVLGINYGGED